VHAFHAYLDLTFGIMLYYEELFTRSTCSSCQQEIPGLGIECVECQGGNFRICTEVQLMVLIIIHGISCPIFSFLILETHNFYLLFGDFQCFATLAEIGQHKPEHRYRFFVRKLYFMSTNSC